MGSVRSPSWGNDDSSCSAYHFRRLAITGIIARFFLAWPLRRKRHEAAQIDIECYPNRPAAQLDCAPSSAVPPSECSNRCVTCSDMGRQRPAKGSADWARRREPCEECTPDSIQTLRKLISATRAEASPLCFHGPNRPSAATRASQSAWISSLMSAGSETVRPTSSRNSAV